MRAFLAAFFLTLGVVCALAQADNHVGGVGTGMYVGNIVNGAAYSYANGLGVNNVTVTPRFSVSGPSSGVVEAASTAFTLTLSGATFNGSQTITISDGSEGGTITPSVGSSGVSSVTVTPTNGATGFTFTYIPVIVATITLTFTNAQSWTNQSPLSYISSSCAQATTLNAKLDGGQNTAAVTALVCGGVVDGWWAKMDFFYMYAINSTGNAVLNWVSTSFSGTLSGSPTFTPNTGYAGNGTTSYFNTGDQPAASGGNFTLNSASMGLCDLTATASTTQIPMGASDSTDSDFIGLRNTVNATRLNNVGTSTQSDTITNSIGSWAISRTASTGFSTYGPSGSSTPDGTPAFVSTAIPPDTIFILARNNNGAAASFSSDTFAYAWLGGGITGTDYANLYKRAHTYLVAVGASGC